MVKHEDDVLKRSFHMFGTPTEDYCPKYLKMKKFVSFQSKHKSVYPRGNLTKYFPNAPPDALDLLEQLMCLDASKRILAKNALKHPFLTSNLTEDRRSRS